MLFTFPSRYWSTIGLSLVFSLAGWSRRIHAGFLVPRATQDDDRLRAASHTGLSPSSVQLSRWFRSQTLLPQLGPTTPGRPEPPGFGLIPGRSPLLGESFSYFLFLRVLRCFSSPRSPPYSIWIPILQIGGLSHSEIPGSMVICTYPRLIAACHVLHRL